MFSSPSKRVGQVALIFAGLTSLMAGGCFRGPSISKITCTDNTNCPSGYTCVIPGKPGGCMRTDGGATDGSRDRIDGQRSLEAGTDGLSLGDAKKDVAPRLDGQPDVLLAPDTQTTAPDTEPTVVPEVDAAAEEDVPTATVPDAPILIGDVRSDLPVGDVTVNNPPVDSKQDTAMGPPPVDALQPDTTTPISPPDAASPDVQEPQPDAPIGAPLGTNCTSGSTCASGVCADNVCCDGPCTGCKACTLALTGKTTGQCNFIQAGKVAHSACAASGTTCGTDGYCDGNGACRVTASGTPCGSTCTGSTYTPNTCNGAGACMPGASTACAPYACDGDVCATSCPTGTEMCGNACVDEQSNSNHCGSCNHSCLGGTCSEGKCQPYLLAEESTLWEGAGTFMLTGDKVFIEFGARGATPTNWAVDTNGGGAVKLRDFPLVSGQNRSQTVALDGRLYWFTYSGSAGQLNSCPQNSCTAANTTAVLPISVPSSSWVLNVPIVIADPVNHEIVWHEQADQSPTPAYSHYWKRSGPNGPARSFATYATDYSENWVAPNNRPDRLFTLRTDDSTWSTYTLYSLLTTSSSASPLAITGSMSNVNTYATPPVLANSTAAFVSTSSSYSILRIPLPNGLVGAPPTFYTGNANWILVDDTDVYGTTVGSTNDGIWRCTLSSCSPAYVARNFLTNGYKMISDSTSVYILDRVSGGMSFKLWRMAK